MQKFDYKKDLKHLYKPSTKKIESINVPEMNFLMIDGSGDPNTEQTFSEGINALFSVSYTLKFMIKKGELSVSDNPYKDYAVFPLEGLWWADDMSDFTSGNKDKWKWTLMIVQPDIVNLEMIQKAADKVEKKKKLSSLSDIYFEKFAEGKSAQIMYIGPYTNEGPTIKRIHEYIEEQNRYLTGKHHEIYLSDFRRTAPEKLKTIIRQPFS